jgi:adenylate cyclase class 2
MIQGDCLKLHERFAMARRSGPEIEIKLPLSGAADGRRRLRQAGFRVARRRVFESNVLFDTPERSLRARGLLVRLRTAGTRTVLTFKGRAVPGKHKIREEIETELNGGPALAEILQRLGYRPSFRYEKYRTEYAQPDGPERAMLDETPVGVFLELEGPPRWIDRMARRLGFTEAGYITASYAELHRQSSPRRRDMLFRPKNDLRTR